MRTSWPYLAILALLFATFADATAVRASQEEYEACYEWLSYSNSDQPFSGHVGTELNRFVQLYHHLPENLPRPTVQTAKSYIRAVDEGLLARNVKRMRKNRTFWESVLPEARALLNQLPYSSHLDYLATRIDTFVRDHHALPHSRRGIESIEGFQETVLARNLEMNLHHNQLFLRLSPTAQSLWRKNLGIPGSND